MLKLSNRGLYGMKALYELSYNYGEAPLSIREISRRHDLPVPFLEQVLHRLKQCGLVNSRRGINGGYQLSRHPRDITIGDVVRALEGPIALCECLKLSNSKVANKRAMECVTSDVYRKLGKIVEDAFDSMTLFDLTVEHNEKTQIYKGTCNL